MKTIKTLRIWIISFFVTLFLLPALPAHADNSTTLETLRAIPVQHAGRIKPFESFANEAVLFVTGRTRFQNTDPTKMVWLWMSQPEKWNTQPLIKITHPDLKKDFSLMMINGRVSPEVILNHEPFMKKVEAAFAKQQKDEKLSHFEKQVMQIHEKAVFFQDIGRGNIPGWVARPDDPEAGWLTLMQIINTPPQSLPDHSQIPVAQLSNLASAIHVLLMDLRQSGDFDAAEKQARDFADALHSIHSAMGISLDEKMIGRELFYNKLRPFSRAWVLYLLSVLISFGAMGVAALRDDAHKVVGWLRLGSLAVFLSAFGFHTYGFYLRCMIAGRPPVTNMYESMIWVSWAVCFFALILFLIYKAPVIRNTAAIVSGVALLLAQSFPVALDPHISPLVPVLRSNLWLTIHVLTITLSYGAFLLAWGLGHAVIATYAAKPVKSETHVKLTQFLYRTLQVGVILLAAGTVLGGVWANYSWGRFWGWDPKETWALIALLGYITVLHGRFTGWLGPFGLAVGSVVAFLGVLMAWYGVNFVLAAGLHSYGFGGGGLPAVLSVIGVDLAIIATLVFIYKRRTRLIIR